METIENKTGIPLIGEKMPSLKVQTTHGVKNIPDDYKGKWMIYSVIPEILLLYVQRNSSPLPKEMMNLKD